jgi:hypothetical protein
MMFDNPDNLRLWRLCARLKLPITIHINHPTDKDRGYPRPDYWYGGGVEPLERAMQAVPDAIIIGHGQGFWGNISGDGKHLTSFYPDGPIAPGGAIVRMLRQYPNLYADLSGKSGLNVMQRDPAFARDFLIEFQDKLLFGRDCFDNRCREHLESLDLPHDVYRKIMGENAARLVPVNPPAPD